jgi:hypothetical protein
MLLLGQLLARFLGGMYHLPSPTRQSRNQRAYPHQPRWRHLPLEVRKPPAGFRRIRASTKGLIAVPWTPASFSLLPAKKLLHRAASSLARLSVPLRRFTLLEQ